MVGLPARGKTYISQKVVRYLNWLGVPARTFNVGEYRRAHFGTSLPHEFFDYHNVQAYRKREEAAKEALEDLLAWLATASATVAVYDATNTTKARRKNIVERCHEFGQSHSIDVQVLFVESVCEDEDIVTENIRAVKITSPDYAGLDPVHASVDFRERIRHYEEVYETMDESELTYLKLINVGKKVIVNRIRGYLESRMVYYLMNLHIEKRSIFFTRVSMQLWQLEE